MSIDEYKITEVSFYRDIDDLEFGQNLSMPLFKYIELRPRFKSELVNISMCFISNNELTVELREKCATIFSKYFPEPIGMPVHILYPC